nr:protein DGS1, mitochondrial [Tanacetum cinerariifolium]
VKAIDRVFSIKSKSNDTGKSNSPKIRCVPMSERVLSPQPVTQYSPITGEVRKESEKAAIVKKNFVVSKSKVAAVVSEKSTVVKEKDVTSKVGKSNVLAVTSKEKELNEYGHYINGLLLFTLDRLYRVVERHAKEAGEWQCTLINLKVTYALQRKSWPSEQLF